MAKSFRCKVVTPMAALVNDEMVSAVVPAHDGQMGLLPGRAPILAKLGLGELKLEYADSGKAKGGSRTFLLDGGFMQMAGGELTIIAEQAFPAEELILADAEAELKKAEASSGGTAVAAEKRTHDVSLAKAKIALARRSVGGI